MFAYRSIFTAAVAFATLTSAIPVSQPSLPAIGGGANPASKVTDIITGLGGGKRADLPVKADSSNPTSFIDTLIGSVPAGLPVPGSPGKRADLPVGGGGGSPTDIVGSIVGTITGGGSPIAGAVPGVPGSKREDKKSPSDVITGHYNDIHPKVSKIRDLVKEKDFDRSLVKDLIEGIEIILRDLLADLTVIVDGKYGLEILLSSKGLPCTIQDIALVVYNLLFDVVTVLLVVLKLVGVKSELGGLIYILACLLVNIVELLIGLIVGLDFALAAIIGPIAPAINALDIAILLTKIGYHP